jgi:hypothetical protein
LLLHQSRAGEARRHQERNRRHALNPNRFRFITVGSQSSAGIAARAGFHARFSKSDQGPNNQGCRESEPPVRIHFAPASRLQTRSSLQSAVLVAGRILNAFSRSALYSLASSHIEEKWKRFIFSSIVFFLIETSETSETMLKL